MTEKIKVVWLCHFSNPFVHRKLDLGDNCLAKIVKRILHRPIKTDVPEFANWVSNGIAEFETIDGVELHVISPYPHLKHRIQEISFNGVYYHFFRSETYDLLTFLYLRLFKPRHWRYKKNRKVIASFIRKVQPSIVHLFGAENPYYSLAIIDVPKNVITIAQLQTLVNDSIFQNNYSFSPKEYLYRAMVEKSIIKEVDYLATPAIKYRNIICKDIRSDAIILNIGLALHDPIVKDETEKEYDFVYFASNINKAADLALEAFGLAYKQRPELTLDIIGGCDVSFMQVLKKIIIRYGMEKAIHFEGLLPSHDDVLVQVRKSKYALLPLKVDLVSGTIREAMSNGLPVLTTDTGEFGTQKLNSVLQCVLISEVGNHQALADNMIRLLDDTELAETLRQNSYQQRATGKSNKEVIHKYVDAYKACMNFKENGISIPEELVKV